MRKVAKKTIGIIVTILGLILQMVPIPLVPFFFITLYGLHLLEVDHIVLEQLKQLRDKYDIKDKK